MSINDQEDGVLDVLDVISDYFGAGGLFNPELMEHDKVSNMVGMARVEITTLRAKVAELTKHQSQYVKMAETIANLQNELATKNSKQYVVRRQFLDMVCYAYAHHHGFFDWGALCQAVKFDTELEAKALIASMSLANDNFVSIEKI